MTHDDNVFSAIAYYRNVGATRQEIRHYLTIHEVQKRTPNNDLKSLQALEENRLVIKVVKKWFLTPQGSKLARGSAILPNWHPSDAWIFAAVLFNRELEECRLQHIIATSDFINHAIPTHAEMHGALNRLASGHLIKIHKGITFKPTESAMELLSKVEANCGKQVLEIVEGLRKLLDCPCCGVRLKSVRWGYHLDEATMKEACRQYRGGCRLAS